MLILHSKHATGAGTSTSLSGFSLHLLGDFDVDLEEFGDTPIEADALALVEFGFAVVGGDTFCQT